MACYDLNEKEKGFLGRYRKIPYNKKTSEGLLAYDYEWEDDDMTSEGNVFNIVFNETCANTDLTGDNNKWNKSMAMPILPAVNEGQTLTGNNRRAGSMMIIKHVTYDVVFTSEAVNFQWDIDPLVQPFGVNMYQDGHGIIQIGYWEGPYNETDMTPNLFIGGGLGNTAAPLGYWDDNNSSWPYNGINHFLQVGGASYTVLHETNFKLKHNKPIMYNQTGAGGTLPDLTMAYYPGSTCRVSGVIDNIALPIKYGQKEAKTIRYGTLYIRFRLFQPNDSIVLSPWNTFKLGGLLRANYTMVDGYSPTIPTRALFGCTQGGPWGVERYFPDNGNVGTHLLDLPYYEETLKDWYVARAEGGKLGSEENFYAVQANHNLSDTEFDDPDEVI